MERGNKTVDNLAPRGLGIQAAAFYLGVTTSFIRSKIWNGEIQALMLGKRHIIDKADLDLFLERQKRPAA
jgi:excisionase family DNA binding protein